MNDRPTLAERYSVATESSNLRVTHERGPVDLIIAAGFANSPGGVFMRLRSEFDQAHAEVKREAAGQNLGVANERLLVMMRLKSLKAAKVELAYMASARAARRGFVNGCMTDLSWQALSTFLDSRCTPCGGTGLLGGYDGSMQTRCKRCDGGNRRGFVGKTDAERSFVTGLVGDIEEAMQRFEARTERALR